MRYFTGAVALTFCMATVIGCVSQGTHTQTLTDLEQARKATAQTAAALEALKQQTAAEIAALQQEKARLSNELAAAQSATKELERQVATLQEDKQNLMSGTTTAQEEIARLQKRAGGLETEMARAADLTKRLEARDQEIGKLQDSIAQEKERLKAEEAEKARLEQERAAKEAEIERLTKTHEDLTKSLQAEIAKGDIKIKQVRDRLTINMVDRVLFDSGQAQVKPTGLKVLKQVSDILKKVNDKQIRIEGHTDNVPIRGKLKERYPTNWELSTARATNVVRYLIEDGGVDRANLLAVGYAENRPVASNDAEEGRTANRRIEIVLYPKDLSEIASQIKQ